jgi:hypothetical protein
MCVRRVGAVGLGGKHPTIAVFLHGLRLGLRSLERALPAPSQRAAHGHRTHQPNAPPRLVSCMHACMRPTAGARRRPNHNDHKCSHTEYSTYNNEQQHLNRDPATPRKVARTRRRISDRPIRAGHRPARVLPDRPDGGPDQGPRNEKKPWKKRKSLTAGHYSTKDHLRDLPKTELNHKSRLPHGNVLERGFTVARGAKRCPCSSVVHLR